MPLNMLGAIAMLRDSAIYKSTTDIDIDTDNVTCTHFLFLALYHAIDTITEIRKKDGRK